MSKPLIDIVPIYKIFSMENNNKNNDECEDNNT